MKKIITLFTMFLFCAGLITAQNLDLIFNQPYHDGGSAAASAMDTEAEIDFEVADNFSGLADGIEEFVFYGLAMKFISGGWVEQVPADTEPFFIRFYEYAEGETTGLIAPVTGSYNIGLLDSFGDGWNGGLVSVFVNGVAVLNDITLAGGPGPEYHEFEAEAGDEISTTYTPGDWAFENYYAIIDPDDNIIAEDGGTWENPGASTPQGIAPGGDPAIFEPDWANPIHEFSLDAEVSHVGSIWNGARQLYKFTVNFQDPVELDEAWISAQINANAGSGTWFLWLNSLAGDELAWQRTEAAKTAFSRDMADMSGVSEIGELLFSRDALDYDLGFELWGGELADPPLCATNPNPTDEAEGLNINGNLSWTGNPAANGYKLYFGQLGGSWDIENGTDLGNVTSYAFSGLDYETTYEWKVVPYNDIGDAEDCPVWTFTTMPEPPIGSTCENPYMATLPIVDYMDNTEAYGNNYASTWIAPTDSYLNGHDFVAQFTLDESGFLSGSVAGSWTGLIIVEDCPNPTTPAEVLAIAKGSGGGSFTNLLFEAGTYFAIVSTWPSPQFTDFTLNLSFEAASDSPEFEISDDEWDFGSILVGQQSVPKTFTITNTGLGNLVVQAPALAKDTDFIVNFDEEDFPASLAINETVSFNVVFAPTSGGPKTGSVNINYNDGSPQSTTVNLTGEGLVPPSGSTCEDPYMATLPIVDYMDNTEAYGNNYASTWITPTSLYLNGYDFVAQFTLTDAGFLTGSVAGSWTGLIIVQDCPNPTDPAEVLAIATGSAGGFFTDVFLEAGTYFAIVSTYPAPQFTDFTLNLSFELPPTCPAPSALTATGITHNSAMLGWTPGGTETEWNIEWGETGFEQGTGTMITGTSNNPYELTGLDAGTGYAFYVQAVCDGEESDWAGPRDFTTEFTAPVPYFEGFAATTPPAGWTTTGWTIGTTAAIPPIDGNYIRRNLWGSVPTAMFTTLNIGPVAADMELSFDYVLANFNTPFDPPEEGSGDFIVAVSTDFGETYEEVETIVNNGVAGWQNYSVPLDEYVGEFVKVKITGNRISGDYFLAFDNFFVGVLDLEEPPLCASNPVPANDAVNVPREGNLNWSGYFTATGYKLYLGTSGRAWDIVDGEDLGNVTTYAYEDLDYLTTYNWKVVPYNDAGDAIDCPVWSFTTEEYIFIDAFPWFESFEDEFPPPGWSNTGWEQSRFGVPNTGEEWAYSNLAGSELTTPEIQIPPTKDDAYELSFWYRAEGASFPQDMDVLLSTDGENFNVVVAEIAGATNTVYEEFVYSLEAYAGQSIWVKFIGLTGAGGFDWGILLDDVGVSIPGVEPPVFYEVTFIVEDEDGASINNATITLGEVTNPVGDYVFEVEAGIYDYLVTADDYFDVEGDVEVVDDDVTEIVVMTLDIEFYTVTYNVVGANGTLTAAVDGEEINSGDEVQEEKDVVFTATPEDMYRVKEWTLNGEMVEDHIADTFIVEDLSEDIAVTVEFEEIPVVFYTVTFEIVGENGALEASVLGVPIDSGDEVLGSRDVLFEAMPDPGYKVKEWTLNGDVVTVKAPETFTVENLSDDIHVTVEFEVITHVVNFAVVGLNGTLTASVDGEPIVDGDLVEDGKDVVFDALPDEEYRVKEWRVNGVVVPDYTANTYTVEDLSQDINVTVEFEEIPIVYHVVTFEVVGANGTLTASVDGEPIDSGDEVREGKNVLFTATPEANFQVKEWRVNGVVVDAKTVETYLLADIDDDVFVTVEFEVLTFVITYHVVGENGSLTATVGGEPIESGDDVPMGSNVQFVAEPDEGYQLRNWRRNGVLIFGYTLLTYNLNNVTANTTITVEFEPIPPDTHIVNFNVVGNNGTLEATVDDDPIASGDEVEVGSDVLFTATPDEGYQVLEWTLNGEVVDDRAIETLLVEDLDDDITVTVEFEMIPLEMFIVMFEVIGNNGTLEATVADEPIATGDEVEEGSDVLFTATPDEGYQVLQWTLNGDVLGDHDANTLMVIALSESIIVTVEFEEVEEEDPPVDLHIAIEEDVIVVDEECFFTMGTIAVAGGEYVFTVKDGAAVALAAGQKIRFLPGSSVESGGYLHAYISDEDPCGIPIAREEDVIAAIDPMEETRFGPFFKVYPNPTTGDFTVELLDEMPSDQKVRVEIYNLMGTMVSHKELRAENQFRMSLLGQEPGMYIIRVFVDGQMGVERLIKR